MGDRLNFSASWQRIRADALKDFAFFDDETVPVDVCKPVPLRPLKSTSAIILTGYVPSSAIRFAINLKCKTLGNVALHFNPRLDRNYVVRNSKIRGYWDVEETCSPSGPCDYYIFRRNTYVHIMIFCTENAFQIAVNGEHFCSFSYRLPLEDIMALECDGSIDDVRIRQLNLFVYPDPKICRNSRSMVLTVDRPLIEYLDVPIDVSIGNQFKAGTRLFITGRLKLLPHSFYVNLQKGKTIYPHPVIALHLNPRFQYGGTSPYVVMNSWSDGSWKNEERHHGHLSWMPGRDFLLTIRCEQDSYTVWLNSKMVCEFKHRMTPTIVDTLCVTGDIVIYQISMCHST